MALIKNSNHLFSHPYLFFPVKKNILKDDKKCSHWRDFAKQHQQKQKRNKILIWFKNI